MSIEWWWSRTHPGWSDAQISSTAPDPYLNHDGVSAVVVEGIRHRVQYGLSMIPILGGSAAIYAGALSGNWVGAFGLAPLGLGLWLMLRFAGLSRHSSLVALNPAGVVCDGLFLPWGCIERVAYTRLLGPQIDIPRSFLAPDFRGPLRMWNLIGLEVTEFDAVRGLRPFMTGLADLNHPRRIVLAETGELRDPRTLYAVLDHLISHPKDRELLDGDVGLDLVTYGPSLRRSS